MPKPTISVVIPCYNAAPFLRETLDSVLAQTYPAEEILLIDDGSTDDSAAIAASYGPPVRVLRQENQGESVARNRGIDEATGEWVAFLDADDLWLPEKLQRQIQVVRRDHDCRAVHTEYRILGTGTFASNYSALEPLQRYSPINIALNQVLQISTLIVKRDVAPRFPEWATYGEDLIFALKVARLGTVVLVPQQLLLYRLHGDSQSQRQPGVEACWFETLSHWLDSAECSFDEQTKSKMRAAWIRRLVSLAQLAKWKREWDTYWPIRRCLEKYDSFEVAAIVNDETIYPRWLYPIKDAMDRVFKRPSQTD